MDKAAQHRPSHFPPIPALQLPSLHGEGEFLVMPAQNAVEARRFQIKNHLHEQNPIARIKFEHLLFALKQGHPTFGWNSLDVGLIRQFYSMISPSIAGELTPALIDHLHSEVERGTFVVFYFERHPTLTVNKRSRASLKLDDDGPVAGWTAGHKIVAMLHEVPSHLVGAAKAKFEAFLTPKNVALLAASMAALAGVQAVPGADAVVDALVVSLAWIQFGWAGVIGAKDLVEAFIAAIRAKSHRDVNAAAERAANALIELGVTALLYKIVARVKEGQPNEEALRSNNADAPGSTNDMMKRYNAGNKGVTYPRRDDQFRPQSNYNPNNPTADQKFAERNLRSQGWKSYKIKQVLNSGSNFTFENLQSGDPVYKIGNSDLDPAGSPSPFLLDQNSYQNLVDQGYVGSDGSVINPAGIKQTLALPCYNLAQQVFAGTINKTTTAIISDINPASELFNLDTGTGDPITGQLFMTGGGSQASIDPNAISW